MWTPARRLLAATAVAAVFGLLETAVWLFLLFGPPIVRDTLFLSAITLLLVYLALRLFVFLSRARYRVKLWHAPLILLIGTFLALLGAGVSASAADHWLEGVGKFYFGGMIFTFLLPIPILLIYDKRMGRNTRWI